MAKIVDFVDLIYYLSVPQAVFSFSFLIASFFLVMAREKLIAHGQLLENNNN